MNCFVSVSWDLLLLLYPHFKIHYFTYPFHVQKVSNRVFVVFLQTKWDFTLLGGVLVSVLFAMIIASFIMIFLPKSRILNLVYSSIGAVLFSVYLVYDVQLIAGGRKYEFDVDDYIPAALAVYLDIINIFLFLLRILGDR